MENEKKEIYLAELEKAYWNIKMENNKLKKVLDEIEKFIEQHNKNAGDLYYKYDNKYLLSEIKDDISKILDKAKGSDTNGFR